MPSKVVRMDEATGNISAQHGHSGGILVTSIQGFADIRNPVENVVKQHESLKEGLFNGLIVIPSSYQLPLTTDR
jgi:hypothetical protein